jgi:hypothetical protein
MAGSRPPTSCHDPVGARAHSNAAFGTMRLWSRPDANRRQNPPAHRSWPKSRRPHQRRGNAKFPSLRRRRRRPDYSATHRRIPMRPDFRGRTRKLLPGPVTAAPAEISELITIGAGIGGGVGVGVGLTGGACAGAEDGATTIRLKTTATKANPVNLRPARAALRAKATISRASNAIPKRASVRQKAAKSRPIGPICCHFAGSVNRSRPFATRDCRPLLSRCRGRRRGIATAPDFREARAKPAGSLLRRKFRVAIPCTIGFRPFDCAFRD